MSHCEDLVGGGGKNQLPVQTVIRVLAAKKQFYGMPRKSLVSNQEKWEQKKGWSF